MADPIKVVIDADTSMLLKKSKEAVDNVNKDLKTIDPKPVADGFKNAGNEVESFSKKTKSFLSDLKQDAGRGGALAQSLKVLNGAGAVAGIGLAAREFGNLGEKVAEASDKLRSGNATLESTVSDVVRSLPIIGDLTKGFDALGEAISGDAYQLGLFEEGLKKVEKVEEETTKTAHDSVQRQLSDNDKIIEAKERLDEINHPNDKALKAKNAAEDAKRNFEGFHVITDDNGLNKVVSIEEELQIRIKKDKAKLDKYKKAGLSGVGDNDVAEYIDAKDKFENDPDANGREQSDRMKAAAARLKAKGLNPDNLADKYKKAGLTAGLLNALTTDIAVNEQALAPRLQAVQEFNQTQDAIAAKAGAGKPNKYQPPVQNIHIDQRPQIFYGSSFGVSVVQPTVNSGSPLQNDPTAGVHK